MNTDVHAPMDNVGEKALHPLRMNAPTRRDVMVAGLVVAAGTAAAAEKGEEKRGVPNPAEDLMREHGVLRRVLLIYTDAAKRIDAGSPPPADAIAAAAKIIQGFVEGYHEKVEGEHVFPKMKSSHAELVETLLQQHEAGRKVTANILSGATAEAMKSKDKAQALATNLRSFIRMYEPHAAREDTILFPAFHKRFSQKEFDELGAKFEDLEDKLVGKSGGFDGALKQVEELEKALGLYELKQFTP